MFSPSPTLYYRGSSRITTVKGCLTTLVIGIAVLGITAYELIVQLQQDYQVKQYNSIHREIDLLEFNPFLEDSMKIAFSFN